MNKNWLNEMSLLSTLKSTSGLLFRNLKNLVAHVKVITSQSTLTSIIQSSNPTVNLVQYFKVITSQSTLPQFFKVETPPINPHSILQTNNQRVDSP